MTAASPSIGRWPWRRALHAQLVDVVTAQNPKAIGLDILFSEPDLDYPLDDALLAPGPGPQPTGGAARVAAIRQA